MVVGEDTIGVNLIMAKNEIDVVDSICSFIIGTVIECIPQKWD